MDLHNFLNNLDKGKRTSLFGCTASSRPPTWTWPPTSNR